MAEKIFLATRSPFVLEIRCQDYTYTDGVGKLTAIIDHKMHGAFAGEAELFLYHFPNEEETEAFLKDAQHETLEEQLSSDSLVHTLRRYYNERGVFQGLVLYKPYTSCAGLCFPAGDYAKKLFAKIEAASRTNQPLP
jgi:hypothetical protein